MTQPTTAQCIEWLDMKPITTDRRWPHAQDDCRVSETIRAKLLVADEMAKALEMPITLNWYPDLSLKEDEQNILFCTAREKALTAWRKAGGK